MISPRPAAQTVTPPQDGEQFWFPGRWVSGVAMIAGPLLLVTGVLLRVPFHFFYPQQLAATTGTPP